MTNSIRGATRRAEEGCEGGLRGVRGGRGCKGVFEGKYSEEVSLK